MLGAIWAQSRDGVIGFDGDMPWHIPEDLAHFKEITLKYPVIMGRRTWESLPEKVRPLPGRENIILSSRPPGIWSRGAEVLAQLPEITQDTWIMGGAQIYAATLADVDVLEVTEIDAHLRSPLGDAAVLAPAIPASFELVRETGWRCSERGTLRLGQPSETSGPVRYRFHRYERKEH